MGMSADSGERPVLAWALHATERWLPAPLIAPRLISLPTGALPSVVAPVRPAGEPSRMVAMALVLATWRAAERDVASLAAADPGRVLAEAAVVATRADYHRLFAKHRVRRQVR